MKNGTSLYLDLIRFSAAMMVFLEHLREHTRNSFRAFWNLHPFWKLYLNPISLTAVIVFFVLSGYVIAHVLSTRENTPFSFAASRFARLYSVVAPALVLVAVTNYLEFLKFPHAFDSFGGTGAVIMDYVGYALFTSNFWIWSDLNLANAPFWTLSLEAAYYVGIALLVFASGRTRAISLVVLALLAGPTMILLAPTWLVGYGTYHLSKRRKLPAVPAIVVWAGSALLLMLCPLIQFHFREHIWWVRMPDNAIGAILASYAAAICFAVNMFAFNSFAEIAERLFLSFTAQIRWLGSITFALYLFHQPLLSVFMVYTVGVPASASKMILLVIFTFLIVSTLGRACEQSKNAYKNLFIWMWGRLATRFVVAE